MQNDVRTGGVGVVVLALALGLAGCFETETVLGPVEQAAVDPKLVGEWTMSEGDDAKPVEFSIRNFDGHALYVEQRESGRETVRYAAHLADVKGVSFVHVRGLTDDGALEKKHVILRVDRPADGKVNLRQLNGDFFADQPHDTTEKLRAIVEKRLEDAAMYDGETIVLTRKAQ